MDEPTPQPPVEAPIQLPVSETTWLEGIAGFESRPTPDGSKILLFTLTSGHRYAIVLPAGSPLLAAVQRAVSPVAIAGPGDMPNGNGASPFLG